jgi:hypothetical protein
MNWVPTMRHQIVRQATRKPRINICACRETQVYAPSARRIHTQLPLATARVQFLPLKAHNVRPQTKTRGFGVAGSIGLGLGLGMASTYVIQRVVLCERKFIGRCLSHSILTQYNSYSSARSNTSRYAEHGTFQRTPRCASRCI